MLDASGKPPSGILEGTLTDFGSYEECLTVDSRESGGSWTGQYCLLDLSADFDNDPPLGLKQPPPGISPQDIVWDPALQIFWSMNRLLSFRYGACIPSTCTRYDLDTLANYCKWSPLWLSLGWLFVITNRVHFWPYMAIVAGPAGMKVNIHSCKMTGPLDVDNVQLAIV